MRRTIWAHGPIGAAATGRTLESARRFMMQILMSATVVAAMGVTTVAAEEKVNDLDTLDSSAAKQGQAGTGDGRAVIEEIVVTAQKRETLLRETPISMTYLGGDLLSRSRLDSVLDIQHFVPGLSVGQALNAAKITIRGIGSENLVLGGDAGVAFHVDNVFLPRPEAALASFFDVERIEVLRGPQGTLYGRNATGGTINIINKSPTSTFEATSYGEVRSYDAIGGGGAVSGPMGDPRIKGRLSFRVVETDGYVENVVPGRPDLNSQELFSVRGQLLIEPARQVSIHLRADYHEDDDTGPTSKQLGTLFGPSIQETLFGGVVPKGDFVTASNVDSFHKTKLGGVSATVNWDFPGASLTSITAYRENDMDLFVDPDGTDAEFQTVRYIDTSDHFSQEIRLASADSAALEWLLGAYYFEDDSSQELSTDIAGVVVSPDPLVIVPLLIELGGQVKTKSYAAFGNLKWNVTDQLRLTGGLRFTHDEKDVSEYNNFGGLFGPVPLTAIDDDSWEEVTYKVDLQYFPVEKTMLFATYSTGFKSGGFNAGGLTPSYDPEKARNVELGVKSRLFQDRVEVSGTLFHTEYDDLQVGQVVGLAVVFNNAAKATLQGVELEGVLMLSEDFQVSATFSYLDAAFDEYFNTDVANLPAGVQDLSGRHLPNAPEYSFSVTPEYTVLKGRYGNLALFGTYYWQDRIYFESFNNRLFSQPSVGRFDLGATFDSRNEKWRLSVYARNIGDKEAKNFAGVSSAAIGGFGFANLSPPRTYSARLDYYF